MPLDANAIRSGRAPSFLRKPAGLALVFAVWLAVVMTGICAMSWHAGTPGPVIHPTRIWPIDVPLKHSTDVATLIMAVHPECPCSRASLNELEVLMTQFHGRLNASVLFVEGDGLEEDSTATELWKSATGIAGVSCIHDAHGKLAACFGAKTSGQVFLYDRDGILRFDGGITASRGHAGDSDGLYAIQAILNNGQPAVSNTPVFGCSLR